jgi:phosphoribosylamine--glycine ligase
MKTIFIPTINAMNSEGSKFKGVIYFQIMVTEDGSRVIEYNARFGDPETQVVLPLLKTDLMDIIDAVIDEKLADINIEWYDNAAACVVLASGGYPIKYETGFEISGLDSFKDDPSIIIYHAGTKFSGDKIVTAGGRVLCITAVSDNLDGAVNKVYDSIDKVTFDGVHYRHDIGKK